MKSSTDQPSKTFWDLRNKKKRYNDVVKGPIQAGQNARGADAQQQLLSEQYFAKIRSKSPTSPNQSLEPKEVNDLFSDTNTEVNIKPIGDHLINEPFVKRYNDATQYNTLFFDRNCASCRSS